MAIICTVFVGTTVLGLIVLKLNNAKHKSNRERARLQRMTQQLYDRNGLGPNGQGAALRPMTTTIEAQTGHVPISGGAR